MELDKFIEKTLVDIAKGVSNAKNEVEKFRNLITLIAQSGISIRVSESIKQFFNFALIFISLIMA